ncbi:hypothetical protein Barb4_04763 [Bacteroidales bacterium Barb4]|nr:hypothetical protein Barb4_04763 [Bacteroidales bacterium Barb4]
MLRRCPEGARDFSPTWSGAECGVTERQRQESSERTIYSFILHPFRISLGRPSRNPTFRSAPCGAEIGRPCRTPLLHRKLLYHILLFPLRGIQHIHSHRQRRRIFGIIASRRELQHPFPLHRAD